MVNQGGMIMERWICRKKNFWDNYLWEPGMVYDGDKTPPKHFEKVEGYHPLTGGPKKEREAIIEELDSFGDIQFNRKWPTQRLKKLLEAAKSAPEEGTTTEDKEEETDLMADLEKEVTTRTPEEEEPIQGMSRSAVMMQLDSLIEAGYDVEYSKYYSTEKLKETLIEAKAKAYGNTGGDMQPSPD